MRLTDEEFQTVERALTGPRGPELMHLMRLRTTWLPPDGISPETIRFAREQGMLDHRLDPTTFGWRVGDPCREYTHWQERARTVHEWGRLRVMREETFAGRRVLEIGCGCGTNVLTLQGIADSVVGIELEPAYTQFTPLFARMVGVPVPETIIAPAEDMPFPDGEFDVTICLGALQYMRIEEALAEASRVLKPGGVAIYTLSHLSGYFRDLASRGRQLLQPRLAVREAHWVASMMLYPWIGRAFSRVNDPVYPSRRRMKSWMRAAGLELDEARTEQMRHEICYVAVKRS